MNTTLQRAGDIFTTPMDDSLLMMSVSQGKYYNLKGVAGRIWELLEHPVSENELVEQLLQEYDINAATCRGEVGAFLELLRSRKLLREG